MKKRTPALMVAVALLTMGTQPASAGTGGASEGFDSKAEVFRAAMTPGSQHATLCTRTGDYRLTSRFWYAPGSDPETSRLPATRESILGGRVIRLEVGPDARGFRGSGMSGFDNTTREHWYVWTDNLTTGVATLRGTLDADGTGSLRGTRPTPYGPAPVEIVIELDGDAEIHTYYGPSGHGGRARFMELRYEPAGP